MIQSVKQMLSGWGNYPRAEVQLYRPQATRDLADILAQRHDENYISAGRLRSYGDAALNHGGGVIRHDRLNRLLGWDPVEQILEAEAGVTYQDIIDSFLPRGFIVPVTPGTKFVTLGGAMAADVHGKNHHREGSLANFVISLQLLTAAGQVLTCSRAENADVFWATMGGMGLTGIILSARVKLRPVETSYVGVEYQRAANLDAALELFRSDDRYRYSVAWVDCMATGSALGRSILMRGDFLTVAELPAHLRAAPLFRPAKRQKQVPFYCPGWLLNSFAMRRFNDLYYATHGDGYKVVDADTFFYPLDAVLHWNRVLGKRGFVQYQVVIPPDNSRKALVHILETVSRSGWGSFLSVLKAFGPADEGWLSFPMAGLTLTLDIPFGGMALLAMLNELDRIVLQNGGRVYLAKDARLPRATFEAMYPRAEEFRRLKERLDPEGIFSSSQARRIGLTGVRDCPRHVEKVAALTREIV